jgi:hypothetical protein
VKGRLLGVGVGILMVAGLASCAVPSSNRSRLLSRDEAKGLVLEALPLKTRQLPKFGLDTFQDRNFPQFFFFSATWAGIPNGSVMVGFYAVDSSTGDVWSGTECQEEDNPALRRAQARVRAMVGLSDSEYQKVKRKGPMCG